MASGSHRHRNHHDKGTPSSAVAYRPAGARGWVTALINSDTGDSTRSDADRPRAMPSLVYLRSRGRGRGREERREKESERDGRREGGRVKERESGREGESV